MRLKKAKFAQNRNIIVPNNNTKKKLTLHKNKNASMDLIDKKSKEDSTGSIYFNKILEKNFGNRKADKSFPNFKENIPNFQSSIQSILSSEERRQKALKYVINMRNKSRESSHDSLFATGNDYDKNAHETNNNNSAEKNFSKTINGRMYNPNKKNINMFDNQDYNYRYKDNKYKRKLKSDLSFRNQNIEAAPYNDYYIYNKLEQPITPDKTTNFKVY